MDKGVRLLKAHDYDGAIKAFEEAFVLYPSPKISLNIAAALRDSGRYAEAVLAYERYLATPDAPRADDARKAMEETRTHLGGRTYTNADIVEAKRLTDEGAKAFAEGRLEDAYKAWSAAYEHNPLPKLLHSQGICMEKLGANYSAAKLFRAYASADPKPTPKDAAEFSAPRRPPAGAGRALADHRRRPGRRHGVDGARQPAAAAHTVQRGDRCLRPGLPDLSVDSKFLLNKASALLDGGRYAEADLAYGRYLIRSRRAARRRSPRGAAARARAHGRPRGDDHRRGRVAAPDGRGRGAVQGRQVRRRAAGVRARLLAQPAGRSALQPGGVPGEDGRVREGRLALRAVPEGSARTHSDADQVREQITRLHDKATSASHDAFNRGQMAYAGGRLQGRRRRVRSRRTRTCRCRSSCTTRARRTHKARRHAKARASYQLYLNAAPNAAGRRQGAQGASRPAAAGQRQRAGEAGGPGRPQAKLNGGATGLRQGKDRRTSRAAGPMRRTTSPTPTRSGRSRSSSTTWQRRCTGPATRRVPCKAYQQYLNAYPDAPDADKVRKAIQMLLERSAPRWRGRDPAPGHIRPRPHGGAAPKSPEHRAGLVAALTQPHLSARGPCPNGQGRPSRLAEARTRRSTHDASVLRTNRTCR